MISNQEDFSTSLEMTISYYHMKKHIFIIGALFALALTACEKQISTADYQVIPLPKEINLSDEKPFILDKNTVISYSNADEILSKEAGFLADFIEDIADLDEKYTLKYIEDTGNDVISSGRAGTRLIHLLCSSYMYGFFEVIRHDMTKDEAQKHISQLQDFFSHGWDKLFNP